MKINKELISNIGDQSIYLVSITNDNNYSISFSNFGGYIHQVLIPYQNNPELYEDVILGYEDPSGCMTDRSFFNVITGRVCNRMKDAEFTLNNERHKLNNNNGNNHLHGGSIGFNKRLWNLDSIDETSDEVIVSMSYLSKHLEENYPGNLSCITKYKFNNNNEFSICYSATTDQDTIVNITNHNYWNFHGHNDHYGKILNHSVQIYGEQVCEVRPDLIPNGNLLNVANTKYDFVESNIISKDLLEQGGIDINYAVNHQKVMKPVGRVWSNLTRMGVEYTSDQPGLQFYTGGNMHPEYQGKNKRSYGKNYGLCMETQYFPDAINQDNFESPILKAGEKYASNTIIKLSNNY